MRSYTVRPSLPRFGKPVSVVIRHGGSGSGSTTITGSGGTSAGTTDPEGSLAAAEGSIYLNKTTGVVWIKTSGGAANTGWDILIQP